MRYIIRRKIFRIFYRGSYSLFEINFGKLGHRELVIHLFCKDGLVKLCFNKRR